MAQIEISTIRSDKSVLFDLKSVIKHVFGAELMAKIQIIQKESTSLIFLVTGDKKSLEKVQCVILLQRDCDFIIRSSQIE